jgi:NADH dehydrogenase
MATIGRNSAVTELANGWRFGGFVGWLAWLGLHLLYLMGFRNRVNVVVNWAWNYVTFDRGSRILRETERARLPRNR